MHKGLSRALLALALFLPLVAGSASAQYFGQNKVQYEAHEWSIIKTEHFHVYFHEGERRVALDAARMAERAYTRLSTLLDHEIAEPVPIILSASHAEFQQSNVSSGLIGEGTGGFTEFLKRRVNMPVTGDYDEVDHVLTHELVHAFQIDLLTVGGSGLGGGVRWAPPLWVMEGMAEYLSLGEVDELTQQWLRDGALEGYLLPVTIMDRVADIRVYRFGQAIMAYFGASFGDEKIGVWFKKLAATRSLDRSFEEVAGVTFEKFSDNWVQAMRETYLPEIAEHDQPDEFAVALTHSEDELANSNLSPALSADGKHMVFFSDRSLYNDLYLASAIDGQVEGRLVKGERSPDFESLRYFRSTADWSPDGNQICFVALSQGKDAIYVQHVKDRKIERKLRFDLDGIVSPSFSPDGEWIVFAGTDDGSSNLYRVRVDGSEREQLTDDRYLVREPRYSPDGNRIVFVTDRGPGTDFDRLLFSKPVLATYEIATGDLRVLPGQAGRDISPHYFPDGRHLLFISDRTGIPNLFIRDLETAEDRQITDILTGISGIIPTSSAVSLARSGERLVFNAFRRGSFDIFAIKDPLSLWDTGRPWIAEEAAELATVYEDPTAEVWLELPDGTVITQPIVPEEEDVAGLESGPAGAGSRDALPVEAADRDADTPDSADAMPADAGADVAPARTGIWLDLAPPIDLAAVDSADGAPTAATVVDTMEAPAVDLLESQTWLASVETSGESGSADSAAGSGPAGSDSTDETPTSYTDAEIAARLDSLWARVQGVDGTGLDVQTPDSLRTPSRRAEEEVPELAVQEVFAENRDLPDPASFKVERYRPRFSADYVTANGFFADNVGLAAQSLLQFSDILGNQIILVGANVYGSLQDSDLFLGYTNLRRRTNWSVSAFQYRNDFYIFTAQETDDFVTQIYRGANLTLQRPFNRFRRAEFSFSGLAVSEDVYRGGFYNPDGDLVVAESGTRFYVEPGVALVHDNTLYGYTGPISGGRDRVSLDVAAGDLEFRSWIGDVRRYYNLRQQYALALRVLGATSDGRDPQYFRIGGPYTLRGYDYGQFRGTKLAMANVEFRFPLIEQLRLGWPLPLALQGVRGALFFDVGGAW
ncbi:MAG: PD40 domain-containing protein, partial [Candidatus Eisenbacteria bacterium]|nr:PD40 domain-containing protein [Candidatus Eisenbacteria bacterium]